ncbi:winged helix-turn-helix transcriptional regulator [Brevundimonas sp. UBA7534]|uniref:winged helix-turn-helix transcriptional regulator n=1 Tax=Brevundimonas sp. UBA7534 TaxID=1946138 RepID=UPI0025B8837A|nr:helix-turn-helix domain-containing protein [Brevundimonas sp. UBA7534]
MKLEKVTAKPGRRYHDACGAAHGLDLIGERWALLVMRELMFGPRRFTDLKKDLCGLSANVLTQRLEGLEASGIVRRRRLPPPASVHVYELTDWGCELKPIFALLGHWAARSPTHDPTLPLSPVSVVMSLETMFDAARAGKARLDVGLVFGDESFRLRIADGTLTAQRAEVEGAEVVFDTQPSVLAGTIYGGAPFAALEADGLLVLTGDRAKAERFATFFALPPKAF